MAEPAYLFGGWEPIARILLIGTLGYFVIIGVLKATGSRTLSQMNSFDFVITIAIGATFGRALTAKDVPLAELVAALAVLILLQYLATTLQVRFPQTQPMLSAKPVLLFWNGEFRLEAMRLARVEKRDMEAAVRANGQPSLKGVMAIVLESNGRLSILPRTDKPLDLLEKLSGGSSTT